MWQKLNIEDARINMSKVVPYDSELALLDKKQAYFHNNRLTALRKYTTSSAVGYKCFKRKADPAHLVDGELTDYIEINKEIEGGSTVHMMNIADSYYKAEKIDESSYIPEDKDFFNGVVINDTYIGSVPEWTGCTFYKITDTNIVIVERVNQVNYDLLYLKGTKYSDASKNYNKQGIDIKKDNLAIIKGKNSEDITQYYFVNKENLIESINSINLLMGDNGYISENEKWDKLSAKKINFFSYSILEGEDIFETNNDIIYITLDKEDYFSRAQFFVGPLYFTLAYFITERVGHFDTHVNIGRFGLKNNWLDFESSTRTSLVPPLWGTKGNPKPINFINDGFKIVLDINAIYFNMTYSSEAPVFSYEDSTDDFEITHEELLVSNYVNDSIFTENGFVVNYANKIPVSLGHDYKIIARLDTQGAQYLGSDSKYSFIKQNGVLYQISIDKMFPDAAYDEEVNIIESDFCKRIGGYKIFNTTTYWNAIYNDDSDKVLCSCDDWNGRFFTISSTLGNATLKSSSRVGHFWDATLSFDDIPNKAISNELNDFLEIANPTYYWANSQYTLHPGTVAFIYSQDTDIGSAPMIQQYRVTSEGFFRDYSETKIFTHNANYQLVPSILFSEFLNSDIINIIQIGSESYELMKYSYNPATPALVYSEIPISIHIDPTEQRFVIQGSLYYISGSSDNRKILNPYDTSEDTYCCDVTGLRYLGYDSEQGYFYSPATGIIYTFNGANKLNAFLEVDKRIPLESGVIGDSKVGIDVTNIPSMNIIAMAFSDGVLIICNGQSIFIDVQGINIMEAHKEYGLIKINGSYYYFGTNNTIQNLVSDTKDVEVDFNIKSCKIGRSRLENVTCSKHRICIYSDVLNATNKAELSVTLTGLLGRKMFSETLTKTITQRDLVDNEYQWEFNPKNTKAQYFQTEVSMKNADMLEYWMDINEQTEENLVRN